LPETAALPGGSLPDEKHLISLPVMIIAPAAACCRELVILIYFVVKSGPVQLHK